MSKIEYFESREEMQWHHENAKNRVEDVKKSFRQKYEGSVNCDALLEDMKNMYLRDKGVKSLFGLLEREEYKSIKFDDYYNLVTAISFEYGQLATERERYTYKKLSGEAQNVAVSEEA